MSTPLRSAAEGRTHLFLFRFRGEGGEGDSVQRGHPALMSDLHNLYIYIYVKDAQAYFLF